MNTLKAIFITAAALLSLALPACASPAIPHERDGLIHVVASTNVYGDIAKQIGGDRVLVTSIITDPSQDPHSFEAGAKVQLELSTAEVVIQNGGGYDDFVDTLLKGANNSTAKILNVATISGYDQEPASGSFNEHLWYDLVTVQKLATELAQQFTRQDPNSAAAFAARLATFSGALTALENAQSKLSSTASGIGVAITEPVPLYLLKAVGMVNQTPQAFSSAIEAGTDVPPLVLQQTLVLFSDHRVKLLVFNEQTSGPETQQVIRAAKTAGVAVVPMRETLPPATSYLDWMSANLAAVTGALK